MKKCLAYSCLMLCVALAGCQSTPTKNEATKPQVTLDDAQQLLDDAAATSGAEQSALKLQAAALFNKLDKPDRALQTLTSINASSLGDALYANYQWIQSNAYFKQGNIHAAKGRLEQPRLQALLARAEPYPNRALATELAKCRSLRAQIYTDLGLQVEAINERILLGKLLSTIPQTTGNGAAVEAQQVSVQPAGSHPETLANELPDRQINQEMIWMMLMDMPLADLQREESQAATDTHKGWFQLAIVSKNNQRNITQQYDALLQWQRQWQGHPGNNPLPADLELIADIVNNQPKRIAVLLPSSGQLAPVANAIRDGISAAFFTNLAAGGVSPELRFYDVAEGDINEHFDFAVAQGAEVVIGPLSKDKIQALALRPALPVPVLALNQVELSHPGPAELFQLGLGIEDEAVQAAERAFADGHRTALITTPNTTHGERATEAFTAHWQALGGTVVANLSYFNEQALSKSIEQILQLDLSQGRARDLRQLLGSFEFEPRRRQDIDAIFMLATPRLGRQIKPLLAFHYAGEIPVYATSDIYEGTPQSEPDLNGIIFSNLPWFFQNTPEKNSLLKNNEAPAKLQRLYALGVDAFYLYPRLQQLGAADRANFWGQTGVLSLNELGQFNRKQQWAKFRRGKVQALVTSQDDTISAVQ